MPDEHPPTGFAVIDWQRIPKPKRQLEVIYSRVQDVAFAMLAVIMGGPLLLALLTSSHVKPAAFVAIAMVLAALFTVGFLRVRSKRKAARRFDSTGVLRGDGRLLEWADFHGGLRKTRRRTPSGPELLWRYELIFANGETAWLIPEQIKNDEEVFAYVRSLPAAVPK